jgi:hypothetical protein
MSRRDRIIVPVLSATALRFARPNLRESNPGLLLTGRCDASVGAGRHRGWVELPEGREQRRPGYE